MVNRALSIFRPTASDSMLAPAAGSGLTFFMQGMRQPAPHAVATTSAGKDAGHPVYDTRLVCNKDRDDVLLLPLVQRLLGGVHVVHPLQCGGSASLQAVLQAVQHLALALALARL